MPIDFYLTATPDPAVIGALQPALTLGDDMLEGIVRCIQAFTGTPSVSGPPTIDMYGSAIFGTSELPALLSALDRAASHYRAAPPSFSVYIGTEVRPRQRVCHERVSQERLLAALQSLQTLVSEAIANHTCLFVSGE